MKIRTDFVTNSSSSSFILAQKGEVTDKQKLAIADEVLKHYMGKKVSGEGKTGDDVIHDLADVAYYDEDDESQIREQLSSGKDIYAGEIDFECGCYDDYTDLLESLWRVLEESGDGQFARIRTDMSY